MLRVGIAYLAQLLNVHQRTLRIYDKCGLLKTQRTSTNRRMYFETDIEKAKTIQYLSTTAGLNTNGIKLFLHILPLNSSFEQNKKIIDDIIEKLKLTPIDRTMQGRKPCKQS